MAATCEAVACAASHFGRTHSWWQCEQQKCDCVPVVLKVRGHCWNEACHTVSLLPTVVMHAPYVVPCCVCVHRVDFVADQGWKLTEAADAWSANSSWPSDPLWCESFWPDSTLKVTVSRACLVCSEGGMFWRQMFYLQGRVSRCRGGNGGWVSGGCVWSLCVSCTSASEDMTNWSRHDENVRTCAGIAFLSIDHITMRLGAWTGTTVGAGGAG